MFLDLRRVFNINTVRQEHAGMGNGEGFRYLVAADGNMYQVGFTIEHFGYLNAFFNAVAALVAHRPANADFHRKVPAAHLSDFCEDG